MKRVATAAVHYLILAGWAAAGVFVALWFRGRFLAVHATSATAHARVPLIAFAVVMIATLAWIVALHRSWLRHRPGRVSTEIDTTTTTSHVPQAPDSLGGAPTPTEADWANALIEVSAALDEANARAAINTTATPAAAPRPQALVQQSPAPLNPPRPRTEQPSRPPVDLSDPERVNKLIDLIDEMPGREGVSDAVRSMTARMMVDEEQRRAGETVLPSELHATFVGPPGTGKTEVARYLGEIYYKLGRLPRGHVVEVTRTDLVAGTIGGTGPLTRSCVERAMGGVLFIDEAYQLAPTGPQDFGGEATAELLRLMEFHAGEFAVIAAGYGPEMAAWLDSNPGLRSRFGTTITFAAFDGPTLMDIAVKRLADAGRLLDPDAADFLAAHLARAAAAPPQGWANARSVRTLLEKHAIDCQAERLVRQGLHTDAEARHLLTLADVMSACAVVRDARA